MGRAILCLSNAARLAAEKNLGALLASFAAIRAIQPRARLLPVGDGPQRAQLESLCPDGIFAGQRSGEDLAAHYASADRFVFPSLTETFGNVTTEATPRRRRQGSTIGRLRRPLLAGKPDDNPLNWASAGPLRVGTSPDSRSDRLGYSAFLRRLP